MKCQRGSFAMDVGVVVGAKYDEATMEDVQVTEVEGGMQAVVVAVLSRGWRRIPPAEVGGAIRFIAKSRVVVKVVPKQ